ncbi:MAG: hypothetical protein BGO41_12800 [Clostridiales bacterium 38-18]|mgnify:CR=1 FL=1|nr:MAG: hypothetical protein BGO41_12800 [Clostridiales bacterium 38-18]
MTFAFAALIILVASIVQGATSFGFSLLALPLLSFFFDIKVVVPALVCFSLVLNLMILIKLKLKPDIKLLLPLVIFATLTIPIGVKALILIDEHLLKQLVSGILLMVSLLMFFGVKIYFKNKWITYSIAGIISGVLNGSVSLSGPPIVVLLSNEGVSRDDFRATLSSLFFILNIITIVMYAQGGLLINLQLYKLLYLTPIMIVGTFMGIYLGNKINEVFFKRLVLLMLMAMSIINLI